MGGKTLICSSYFVNVPKVLPKFTNSKLRIENYITEDRMPQIAA